MTPEFARLFAYFDARRSWLENMSAAAARDRDPRYAVMNRVYAALPAAERERIEKSWAR